MDDPAQGTEQPDDDTREGTSTDASTLVDTEEPTPKKRTVGARKRPIAIVNALPDDPQKPQRKPATSKRKRKPQSAKAMVNPDSRKGYKYDWPSIKQKFVEGILPEGEELTSESREFLNLKELSERLDVPYSLTRNRAADERWYDLRQDYMIRLGKARQAKRIAELSKESFDFDQSTLRVAKLGMGMVTARMSEIAREVQEKTRRRDEALRLAQAGYDIDPKDLESVIDARELDTLARAALSWQTVGQKALGTDITRMEIQHDVHASIESDVTVTTTIAAELGRDDPDRLAAFLQAAKRAGLLDVVMNQNSDAPKEIEAPGDDAIVDAEIVNEGE